MRVSRPRPQEGERDMRKSGQRPGMGMAFCGIVLFGMGLRALTEDLGSTAATCLALGLLLVSGGIVRQPREGG